jgi:dihydropteroate synthase
MSILNTAFAKPKVMGILNVTPDSFSDGGHFISLKNALKHARQLIAEGADILDIGGESTRPNAPAISVQEELDRVLPILEILRAESSIKLSIDTSKAEVMQAAIASGVDMINDVAALRYPNSLETVANASVQVCLMHMQGEPRTMQENPHYNNVVAEVKNFLLQRIDSCVHAGIETQRIILDVGFGFGKSLQHNLQLLKHLEEFTQLGYPVLVGVSRKSMIGTILNKPVHERLYGGLALATLAVQKGAHIIRTHDVAATVDVVNTTYAVLNHSE